MTFSGTDGREQRQQNPFGENYDPKIETATIAIVAVLFAIAIMFLLHTFSPLPSFMVRAGFDGTSPVAGMWNGMGWMMLVGPFAMLLGFGGFVDTDRSVGHLAYPLLPKN